MSADNDLENLLAQTPTRVLPDDDRRRISEAIRAAERRHVHCHWWPRTVPAWQAIAACLAICLITWSAARLHNDPIQRQPPAPSEVDGTEQAKDSAAFVSIDRPLFDNRRTRSAYRSSITRWRPISAEE